MRFVTISPPPANGTTASSVPATCANTAPATWSMLPTCVEPHLIGRSRPSAMRSSTSSIPLSLSTVITSGSSVARATGIRSSIVSGPWPRAMANRCVGVMASTVWPSRGRFAA